MHFIDDFVLWVGEGGEVHVAGCRGPSPGPSVGLWNPNVRKLDHGSGNRGIRTVPSTKIYCVVMPAARTPLMHACMRFGRLAEPMS